MSAIFQGAAQRTVCRDADSWKVPFKAVWMNTSNHTIGKVWSPENPNGRYPAYSTKSEINNWNYMPSSWFIEDGTYLRLKNLTVGYTIPKAILTKITKGVLENFRVYVTGTDIWENSKINDGWDPEATRKVSDRQRYPFTRTYTVGLNASDEQIRQIVNDILDKKFNDQSGLIYGIGHAVYTLSDPRCQILSKQCKQLAIEKDRLKEYNLYHRFEEIAVAEIEKRKGIHVCANIDFYSGLVYDMLGIPKDLYTLMFVIGRSVGWVAHNIENKLYSGRIIRPAGKYVGEKKEYIKMENR